jgi:hypothetical protein
MFWVGKSDKQIWHAVQAIQQRSGRLHRAHHRGPWRGRVHRGGVLGERALDDDSKTFGAKYGKPFVVDPPPGTTR